MTDVQFAPTHEVPKGGLATWSQPDPGRPSENRVDAGLPVQVLEESLGWARIRCSNGWETWVDGRQLVSLAPAGFVPTHVVPATGLDARPRPDVDVAPMQRLDPGLGVVVSQTWGEWVKVRCENDWEAWVDGRALSAATPTSASGPSARTTGTGSPLALWLPIGGAALAILGGFLAWYDAGGVSVSAWDIRIVSLVTHDPSDFGLDTGPVLLVLVLTALPLVTGRLLPRWALGALAAVAIVLAVLGFVLYADLDPRPDLGIGLIATLVGGLVIGAGMLVTPAGGATTR